MERPTCSPTPAASRCSPSSPAVDDDGVTFRSTYDGSTHRLTPEKAVAVQEQLGADIQMALDVCPPLPSPPEVIRRAMERTPAWAATGPPGPPPGDQALFGIVQGGADPTLRAESARRTAALGFRRLRHRRPVGRRAPRPDAPRPRRGGGRAADRSAPVSDGRRRPGRRWSRRWPSGWTCSTACCRPASVATGRRSPTPAGSSCGARHRRETTRRSTPACGCPVCRRHSRRLSAPPAHGRRAGRRPAADRPQSEPGSWP